MGVKAKPFFTYLANSLRIGDREVPYSLVTAMDMDGGSGSPVPIALNDWAARDLRAKPGDTVSMDYFFWEEPGQLVTRTAEFRVDRIVPTNSGDADMAPVYPGITDASSLRDWDPPSPSTCGASGRSTKSIGKNIPLRRRPSSRSRPARHFGGPATAR